MPLSCGRPDVQPCAVSQAQVAQRRRARNGSILRTSTAAKPCPSSNRCRAMPLPADPRQAHF